MKNPKTPVAISCHETLLSVLLLYTAVFVVILALYFSMPEKEMYLLISMVIIAGVIIFCAYSYLGTKYFQIANIAKNDFNDALKYALNISGIETSPLPDGLFKTKKLQMKDSNIILEHRHISLKNTGVIVLKKAKDTVLYDKILASMKDYMNDNYIVQKPNHKKLIFTLLATIAVGYAVGFVIAYFEIF